MGGADGPTQVTVNAGDEDAARDALEALNVVAAKQPQLLTEGEGLDVTGKAMLSLAASPALEVRAGGGNGVGGILFVCWFIFFFISCSDCLLYSFLLYQIQNFEYVSYELLVFELSILQSLPLTATSRVTELR